MKINDVITEGPIWNSIKQVGAGVKGAVANPTTPFAGATQASARSAGQSDMNAQVKGMMPYWQKQVQALQAGGTNMADTAEYQQQLQDWMTNSGFPGNKDFTGVGKLASTNTADVRNYLAKAVAMNMSGQAKSKSEPAAEPTTGAAAFSAMASQLGGKQPNTMANAPVSKTNVAKPGNPNAAPASPQAPATTASSAPAMASTQVTKSYEMMTPEQRAELRKQLVIIDDRDRLATGTNEGRKSKRTT
jgi:hypothetical protein